MELKKCKLWPVVFLRFSSAVQVAGDVSIYE